MPAPRKSGERTSRRGPRGNLSLAAIVSAAREVLRESGDLGALSIRAVARVFGVAPNALYTYVDSIVDLRHEVGDQLLGEVDLLPLTAGCGRCGYAQLMSEIYSRLRAEPAVSAILLSQRVIGPHSMRLNEEVLVGFRRLGWDPERATRAKLVLAAHLYGHLAIDPETPAEMVARRRSQNFDPAAYPMTAREPNIQFVDTLPAVLDGLDLRHTCH